MSTPVKNKTVYECVKEHFLKLMAGEPTDGAAASHRKVINPQDEEYIKQDEHQQENSVHRRVKRQEPPEAESGEGEGSGTYFCWLHA
ncbi:unnamed protein product [Strongylus vulgaris]|uniref:Uncharacterized protein n=1 Tax=Strongylus vulgaris TaxID=40348 RepID=A0A3P7J9A5_STRVU|nr:unnamed protein product [Strongylus vulgaris]